MQMKFAHCPACGDEVPYVVRDPNNQALIRREYIRTAISLGAWILHECAGSWWVEADGPTR